MVVERNRAVFTEAPTAVPDGNVDVSGGGRWKIWQNAGTKWRFAGGSGWGWEVSTVLVYYQ